ncbi:MAG TPA: class I SAM-dependent methyltransferase [Metalysinibacillus jejuensis]|uniref:Class I SAM-dependent methyltransferase n=1 Tax=Metalysinibacillus jejuensis TaxID=914327 RepID=A0A921NB62_9BACL|nr:class I SAM-dependent methyltransferase [Metalysinibacillus jejuensis]HJH10348.1 class I SAM-dependent methyltransferase [Metalysinibacillus jejuensis]
MEFTKDLSAEYERGIRRTLPSYDAMLRLSQAFLSLTLDDQAHILVAGVGSGNELLHFAQANSHWQFTALDPSQAMLAITSEKLKNDQLQPRVTLVEGTVLQAPLTATFEAATCLLVLHFIKERAEQLATLQKIAEHLQPGAPFIIVCKCGELGNPETEQQFDLWRAYWLQNTKLTPEQVETMEQQIRTLGFLTEADMRSMLQTAGFEKITRFFSTTLFCGWTCFKK